MMECHFVGPMFDRLYTDIYTLKFESVWNCGGLLSDIDKPPPKTDDGECILLGTVLDTVAAATRTNANKKDLIFDSSECRPGYTRLIPIKSCVWMQYVKEGANGKIYLKHLHPLRKEASSSEHASYCPRLLAFKCHWPDAASEWLERERQQSWPPINFIARIEEIACRVVPLSHPFSREKDIEWKFCFDIAAQILSREATTITQRSCFKLFRILVDCSLGSKTKIAYSHLQSVFFYTCEKIQQKTWAREPAKCVSEMLCYLHESIERRYLPCYFLKNNNIIDDFSESEIGFHAERLKILRQHFFVSMYFILDRKGQIVANLHLLVDELVTDFQRYSVHNDLRRSVTECFLHCIVQHARIYAAPKYYCRMLDTLVEASSELETTFSYTITVKDLFLKVLQTLSLDTGWLAAFYIDQKLQLSLQEYVCEGLNTVSLLNFLGSDLLKYITHIGNDIRVPEELVAIDRVTTFVNDFTTLLKDDLSLGSMVYIQSWLFFLELYTISVEEFIHSKDGSVRPEKQQIASYQLRNALLNVRLEMKKLEGNQLRAKIKVLESIEKHMEKR